MFNGVAIPARNLDGILARYVDNLFIWNDDEVHKVSMVGSSVRIAYGRHCFLLCTNHQLKGSQLNRVSIMTRDGKDIITSSGVRHFNDEENPNYLDLAAFDFTEQCQAISGLREGFFNFQSGPPDALSSDIAVVVVAGFPVKDQVYELEEKNHIGKYKRVVLCEPLQGSIDPSLLCVRANAPFDFDPDGMSGGSAFVVQRFGYGYSAFFAGMVVMGGVDRFHILKVGFIERFLRVLVANAPGASDEQG